MVSLSEIFLHLASIGITGEIGLVEVAGPEVYLQLSGKFWHTRSHVLGRAAMYLNARMPEIMHVSVVDPDDLNDFEEVIDEDTGEVIEVIDRRSPDFNGDRETMVSLSYVNVQLETESWVVLR